MTDQTPAAAAGMSAPPVAAPEAAPPPVAERPALDGAGMDLLFREARTHYGWTDRPVPEAKLEAMYDLLRMGPTSANCSPARFVFVRTAEGKARLKQVLSPGNVEKTMKAPVVCIVAHDQAFYDKLGFLYPGAELRGWYADNPALADATALRNGTLQGAYLIMAARAVGLDVAPMSGFDNYQLDNLFFAGTRWKSNFLVAIGHGDPAALPPRNPRLTFDEACRFE